MPNDPSEATNVGGACPIFYERLEQPELLRKINERNADFYEEQTKQLEAQLNTVTLQLALHQRDSEEKRGILINSWSFEGAIDDAEKSVPILRSEIGRIGGSCSKTDALQKRIVDIVRSRPSITERALCLKLKCEEGEGLIEEIDDISESAPSIHFQDGENHSARAPISGLKDRLSRAKKIIRAEVAQSR